MERLQSREGEPGPTCYYCGATEEDLFSQLVHADTIPEFDANERNRRVNGELRAGDTGRAASAKISDATTIECKDSSKEAALPMVRSSAGATHSTNNRRIKNLIWVPVCPRAAETEMRECNSKSRMMQAGSVIVHECCAEFMQNARLSILNKTARSDEAKMIETLVGIGRSKTSPIGVDREGSVYWVFAGSDSLYVSTSESTIGMGISFTTFKLSAGHKMSFATALCSAHAIEIAPMKAVGGIGLDDPSSGPADGGPFAQSLWSVYDGAVEVGRILMWLDSSITSERILKVIISRLFPQALSCSIDTEPFVPHPEDQHILEEAQNCEDEDEKSNELPQMNGSVLGSMVSDVHDNSHGEAMNEVRSSNTKSKYRKSNEGRIKVVNDTENCDLGDVVSANEDGDDNNYDIDHDDGIEGKDEEFCDDENEINVFSTHERLCRASKVKSIEEDLPDIQVKPEFAIGNKVSVKTSSLAEVPQPEDDESDLESSEAAERNDLWWDGEVLETRVSKNRVFYKIHFDGWSSSHDGWFPGSNIIPRFSENPLHPAHAFVYEPPEVLKRLNALSFLGEPNRYERDRISESIFQYSDTRTPLGTLKIAMLVIEAALPAGSVNESDERWGDSFVEVWRESVVAAANATTLMGCQIMLEWGINTAWLKPGGSKLMTLLPSRTHSLKCATTGLISIRLWALDQAINYAKVLKSSSESGKPIFYDNVDDQIGPKSNAGRKPSYKKNKKKRR